MNGIKALGVVMQVVLTAAAVKAALGTLSRPMQGVGLAPSLRNRRLGQVPLEDLDGLWDYDYDPRRWERDWALDYEDIL